MEKNTRKKWSIGLRYPTYLCSGSYVVWKGVENRSFLVSSFFSCALIFHVIFNGKFFRLLTFPFNTHYVLYSRTTSVSYWSKKYVCMALHTRNRTMNWLEAFLEHNFLKVDADEKRTKYIGLFLENCTFFMKLESLFMENGYKLNFQSITHR